MCKITNQFDKKLYEKLKWFLILIILEENHNEWYSNHWYRTLSECESKQMVWKYKPMKTVISVT